MNGWTDGLTKKWLIESETLPMCTRLKTIKRMLRKNQPNLVHKHLPTCSTNIPNFIPHLPREPSQPTDGPTDGHGRVHATENAELDLMQKPTLGNGSNLVHRHFVTCSTNVPSFIPRLPWKPLQLTDGQGRVHAT